MSQYNRYEKAKSKREEAQEQLINPDGSVPKQKPHPHSWRRPPPLPGIRDDQVPQQHSLLLPKDTVQAKKEPQEKAHTHHKEEHIKDPKPLDRESSPLEKLAKDAASNGQHNAESTKENTSQHDIQTHENHTTDDATPLPRRDAEQKHHKPAEEQDRDFDFSAPAEPEKTVNQLDDAHESAQALHSTENAQENHNKEELPPKEEQHKQEFNFDSNEPETKTFEPEHKEEFSFDSHHSDQQVPKDSFGFDAEQKEEEKDVENDYLADINGDHPKEEEKEDDDFFNGSIANEARF
jgi:hypothetical protein